MIARFIFTAKGMVYGTGFSLCLLPLEIGQRYKMQTCAISEGVDGDGRCGVVYF
jgi:hypothetical protein